MVDTIIYKIFPSESGFFSKFAAMFVTQNRASRLNGPTSGAIDKLFFLFPCIMKYPPEETFL